MTIDELKQMLKDGKITQEQFNAMAKVIDPNYEEEQQQEEQPEGNNKGYSQEEVDKLIQSAIDRTANKFGNDNKKLKDELNKIKREKMTDEERKAADLAEKEKELAEKENEIRKSQNTFYAIKKIKEIGLDDGSDKALELVNFVMADDEATIDARIKAFDNLVKKFVKSEVDKTFKNGGRDINKGGSDPGTKNPYAKETFNFTEQMKLEIENPELAAQLRAAAGK